MIDDLAARPNSLYIFYDLSLHFGISSHYENFKRRSHFKIVEKWAPITLFVSVLFSHFITTRAAIWYYDFYNFHEYAFRIISFPVVANSCVDYKKLT